MPHSDHNAFKPDQYWPCHDISSHEVISFTILHSIDRDPLCPFRPSSVGRAEDSPAEVREFDSPLENFLLRRRSSFTFLMWAGLVKLVKLAACSVGFWSVLACCMLTLQNKLPLCNAVQSATQLAQLKEDQRQLKPSLQWPYPQGPCMAIS